jgi:hypothetical protein
MSISESILQAALVGPEKKKVHIAQPNSSKSHEFNIKPISYRVHRSEVTVFGQMSHCLSSREDDQVWFTFQKRGTTTSPSEAAQMVVEKEQGGIIKTIKRLRPVGVAVGAYFGFDAGKYFDMLEQHEDDLQFIDFDGGWESAATVFLEELSRKVSAPRLDVQPGLKLFVHDNLNGASTSIAVGKNVVQAKDIGWNDKASSLLASVPEGKRLELYQHDNYRGRMLELGPGTHIVRDLKIHKLGDEITSVRWENG